MSDDERRGLPSASGMHRVAECTGSEALIATLRAEKKLDERPSPEALSGRRIHLVLAGQEAELTHDLTDDEAKTALACRELRDRLLNEWGKGYDGSFFKITEERFFYYRSDLPLFTGQPDFIVIDFRNTRAIVFNYKTGRKEAAAAADNLQLRTEVVLLKHEYPQLTEIDAAIVEPLVDWEPVRVRYTGNDLVAAEAQLCAIVDKAREQPDTRVAGDWCTYCPARVYCPEAQAVVVSVSQLTGISIASLPRGQDGTVFWEKLKLAKKLIEKLEQAYTELLETEPDALPGYVLPKQGPRHWIIPQPKDFRAAMHNESDFFLTDDEIDGCLTWNLGKLREVFGLKFHLKGVALEDKFKEVAGDSIKRIYSQPFIRPLTKKERTLISFKFDELESD